MLSRRGLPIIGDYDIAAWRDIASSVGMLKAILFHEILLAIVSALNAVIY